MKSYLTAICSIAAAAIVTTSALADGVGGSIKDGPAGGGCGIAAANFGGAYGGFQLGAASYKSTVGIEDILGISGTREETGFTIGGQVGYNWQRCNIVFGIEGELNWTDTERDWGINLAGLGVPPPFANLFNAKSSMEWYGAVKAKAGFAIDSLLLYVTGGIAFAEIQHKGLDTLVGQIGFNNSDTRIGFVVGAGSEFALTRNISWRNEVTFTRFEDQDFNLTFGNLFNGALKLNAQDEVVLMRTGLNFRF